MQYNRRISIERRVWLVACREAVPKDAKECGAKEKHAQIKAAEIRRLNRVQKAFAAAAAGI